MLRIARKMVVGGCSFLFFATLLAASDARADEGIDVPRTLASQCRSLYAAGRYAQAVPYCSAAAEAYRREFPAESERVYIGYIEAADMLQYVALARIGLGDNDGALATAYAAHRLLYFVDGVAKITPETHARVIRIAAGLQRSEAAAQQRLALVQPIEAKPGHSVSASGSNEVVRKPISVGMPPEAAIAVEERETTPNVPPWRIAGMPKALPTATPLVTPSAASESSEPTDSAMSPPVSQRTPDASDASPKSAGIDPSPSFEQVTPANPTATPFVMPAAAIRATIQPSSTPVQTPSPGDSSNLEPTLTPSATPVPNASAVPDVITSPQPLPVAGPSPTPKSDPGVAHPTFEPFPAQSASGDALPSPDPTITPFGASTPRPDETLTPMPKPASGVKRITSSPSPQPSPSPLPTSSPTATASPGPKPETSNVPTANPMPTSADDATPSPEPTISKAPSPPSE